MVEEVVAGVAGEPQLGEDDEVDALVLGLLEEVEGAVGVERAVGDPQFRATRPRRGGSRGGSYWKCMRGAAIRSLPQEVPRCAVEADEA